MQKQTTKNGPEIIPNIDPVFRELQTSRFLKSVNARYREQKPFYKLKKIILLKSMINLAFNLLYPLEKTKKSIMQ